MLLPLEDLGGKVSKRDGPPGSDQGGQDGPNGIMIAAIVVIILIAIAVVVYAIFRNKHKSKHNTKYLPGDTILQKFKRWRKPTRGEYSAQLQPNPSVPSLIGRDGRRSRDHSREPSVDRRRDNDPERGHQETSQNTNGAPVTTGGVDRNTSVRSVMTLPAYTPAARPTEQIIAREGERGGIDTVVEYPETHEEEEARRDEEMESLYQIRRQRRQEQSEREERRRERREARQRGDYETLRRLAHESRQRAESTTSLTQVNSAQMIAEHQASIAAHDRRVSKVQYAELGVARADGSRIRANSHDSDNRPLLDSAASISGMSLGRPSTHSRDISGSSAVSIGTANGSDDGHGTPHFDSDEFEVVSLEPSFANRSRASSFPANRASEERDVTDLGIQIPTELPPEYDDPPNYTSPVEARASARSAGPPRLPSLRVLPSIEVTGAVSPLMPSPTDDHSYNIPTNQPYGYR